MADDNLDTGSGSTPDPVAQVQDTALVEMAKAEDISDYAAERADRDKEAKGEEVNGEDRSARIREALAKARQDTAEARQQNGLDQPDLDHEYQTAEQEWQQAEQSEQTFEQERELARAEGKFMATAEELKAVNPTAHQEITGALGALDAMMMPEQLDVLRREITKGNPRESMVVLHRLTQPNVMEDGSTISPEQKLSYLASLPPAQLASILEQSRVYVQLETDISKKLSRQYAGQPRRHTRAPEPFKRPSGGANPPKNLEALASRGSDISDYVKVRHQQMRKPRDE